MTAKFEVGEYRDRTTRLDVVGLRADGWVDIGECKWGPLKGVGAAAKDLKNRAARYPAEGRTLRFHLFVRRGSRGEAGDVAVHTLEEMYGE